MARGNISVRTRGKKGFLAATHVFEKRMKDHVKETIRETARLIQMEAQRKVPVDTGDLSNSITVDIYNGGMSALVTVNQFYGVYIEYGTGIYARDGDGRKTEWTYFSPKLGHWVITQGHPPQPFFEPAVEAGAHYFVRRLNNP